MSESAATPSDAVYPSRRDLRQRSTGRSTSRSETTRGRAAAPARRAPAAGSITPSVRRSRSRTVLTAFVMTFAFGLVATIALPSYAFNPSAAAATGGHHGHGADPAAAQGMVVASDVQVAHARADTVKATTQQQLDLRALAQATSLRKANAAKFSYSGPTAADYLNGSAKAPTTPFSLSAVFQRALSYRGVPYVFGGATPAGFDCSGFTMYVYAQFGVPLAHSVHLQDDVGTPISEAQAQPGDLVIFDDESHEGFYAGNGEILHAPNTGGVVEIEPLWTSAVHFVRVGAK